MPMKIVGESMLLCKSGNRVETKMVFFMFANFCILRKNFFYQNFAKIAQILFYFHVSHQTLSVFAKIFTNAKLLRKQVFRNNFHIKEIFSKNLPNSYVINKFVKNDPFVSHVS